MQKCKVKKENGPGIRWQMLNRRLVKQPPPPGRPQGSPPLILTTHALTKTRNNQFPFRSLCKGVGGVERSGDPCGRPGGGAFRRTTR